MRRLLLMAALLSFGLHEASAQTLAQISGVVTDPSGAVIPNASVMVTNTATNGVRTVTTNANGLYSFPDLVPGNYNVQATAPGFSTVLKQNNVLQVQQSATVNFTLEVGQATQLWRWQRTQR